jgi:hypothetical protein
MLSTFDVLIGRFDGRLAVPVAEMAPLLGFSYSTFRNRLCAGVPTIPTRLICGKRMVVLTDLAAWLDGQTEKMVPATSAATLVVQLEDINATPLAVVNRGRGRPPKLAGAEV